MYILHAMKNFVICLFPLYKVVTLFNEHFFWFNRELEDKETTDESRAEEREGEESDNDSSSGSDCDFENE